MTILFSTTPGTHGTQHARPRSTNRGAAAGPFRLLGTLAQGPPPFDRGVGPGLRRPEGTEEARERRYHLASVAGGRDCNQVVLGEKQLQDLSSKELEGVPRQGFESSATSVHAKVRVSLEFYLISVQIHANPKLLQLHQDMEAP